MNANPNTSMITVSARSSATSGTRVTSFRPESVSARKALARAVRRTAGSLIER